MIFAFAIPVLGIAGDIIRLLWRQPTAIQRATDCYRSNGGTVIWSICPTVFQPRCSQSAVFVVMGILVLIPVLVFMGGLADTSIALTFPFYASSFISSRNACLTCGSSSFSISCFWISDGAIQEINDSWLDGLILGCEIMELLWHQQSWSTPSLHLSSAWSLDFTTGHPRSSATN